MINGLLRSLPTAAGGLPRESRVASGEGIRRGARRFLARTKRRSAVSGRTVSHRQVRGQLAPFRVVAQQRVVTARRVFPYRGRPLGIASTRATARAAMRAVEGPAISEVPATSRPTRNRIIRPPGGPSDDPARRYERGSLNAFFWQSMAAGGRHQVASRLWGVPISGSRPRRPTDRRVRCPWTDQSSMKILVVDHEKVHRANLADKLAARGHQLVLVADGEQAMEQLRTQSFDTVFADAKVPKVDGVELLRWIKQGAQSDTHVVMMSANGSIPVAVQAVKMGAFDFLKKPIPAEKLQHLLGEISRERSLETSPFRRTAAESRCDIDREIIGDSATIERVKRMIRIASQTDANVLIHGETGVGKDLVASVIHRQSHRQKAPYVKVGCTLLPPSLIESELYGHEEGSFTGADQHRPGRFEMAEGGTIYLDDVDDISLEQQAKLLRVIEEKVFERVGGNKLIKANVRIVASTKLNLLEKVADGTFRQDLYYRLDVLRLRIPPLRSRMEDIPSLAAHLMQRIAGDHPYEFDAEAVAMLCRHAWPGNVRELYHALERAWLVGGGRIAAELLQADLGLDGAAQADEQDEPWPGILANGSPPSGFRAAMDFAEKQLLVDALRESGGNKTAAAQALGMRPSTFRDKLAKHGLS